MSVVGGVGRVGSDWAEACAVTVEVGLLGGSIGD